MLVYQRVYDSKDMGLNMFKQEKYGDRTINKLGISSNHQTLKHERCGFHQPTSVLRKHRDGIFLVLSQWLNRRCKGSDLAMFPTFSTTSNGGGKVGWTPTNTDTWWYMLIYMQDIVELRTPAMPVGVGGRERERGDFIWTCGHDMLRAASCRCRCCRRLRRRRRRRRRRCCCYIWLFCCIVWSCCRCRCYLCSWYFFANPKIVKSTVFANPQKASNRRCFSRFFTFSEQKNTRKYRCFWLRVSAKPRYLRRFWASASNNHGIYSVLWPGPSKNAGIYAVSSMLSQAFFWMPKAQTHCKLHDFYAWTAPKKHETSTKKRPTRTSFYHLSSPKMWKPQHPEGFPKRSAAPARPRVAKAMRLATPRNGGGSAFSPIFSCSKHWCPVDKR